MKISKLFILLMLMLLSHSLVSAQTLVWADEFSNTGAPDPTKWGYEMGYIRNNELQCYTNLPTNVTVKNGFLELVALKENYVYGGRSFNYTSASINTKGKYSFAYGKLEANIKFPLGQGLWPAFWTLGAAGSGTWPANGEIDIMEHVNSEAGVHATCHWSGLDNKHKSGPTKISGSLDYNQFHVYAINWTPSSIKWSVDGTEYASLNILNGYDGTTELNWAHYILLNFAIGGNWPGSPSASTAFPATMYVDWVRVYNTTTSLNNIPSDNSPFKFSSNGKICNVILPEIHSELDLCVFDVNGKKLLTKNTLNSDGAGADISALNKGMYIIRIMTKTKNYSGAFFKG